MKKERNMDDDTTFLKETLVGKTLTDVTTKTNVEGDHYTRLHFGEQFYEYLSRFTANDHQVAVAREALERIKQYAPSAMAEDATEALAKMEEAKTWVK
jgi:hypothetical protein